MGCSGALLNSLGCSLDPPPPFASAIKCQQKSTSKAGAGSSGGSLAHTPGHPAAGRCVRVVPVLPLLLCTRPARPRPSTGGQSPTPAPRQLPWSPPRAWHPRRLAALQFSRFAFRAVCAKSRLETMYCLEPRAGTPRAARRAKRSHARRHIGVVRALSTARIARGKFSRFHTVSQITIHLAVTHCRVLFTIHQFSDGTYPKWAYLDSRAASQSPHSPKESGRMCYHLE
jgi:hypothetical protein